MPWTEDVQWDLESVVAGGPLDGAFAAQMSALEAEVETIVVDADALGEPDAGDGWASTLRRLFDLGDRAHQLGTWAACYASTHPHEPAALRAQARASAIEGRIARAWTTPRDRITRAAPEAIEALLSHPDLRQERAWVADLRAVAHLLLPPGEAALVTDLSEDGANAWGRLYERVSGRLIVTVGGERLSAMQAQNRMESPDRAIRATTFAATLQAWGEHAETCADALTHIYGTRRVLHARLGVDELAEPLAHNRISAASLDAVLQTCADGRSIMGRYLAAKARRMGLSQLEWYDLRAPAGKFARTFTWAQAQDYVVTQFARFSADLADYARHAFAQRWVEAEDRSGKRPGAYCAGLPITRESRVFMTFGGGMNSLLTLAHELGHAYHNHVILPLSPTRRRLTSSLAETASTFAEALVRGAALEEAGSDEEVLALLDQNLSDAANFLMNIPMRFHFEKALHRLRAQGELVPEELCETVGALQREWYGPSLGSTHPYFWAEKIHFYLADAPFYNFPYTFGFLFSGLVYLRAQAEGPRWAQGYVALLRETGSGPAEDVARDHLGVDLRDPAAFRPVLDHLAAQVDRYEALAKG